MYAYTHVFCTKYEGPKFRLLQTIDEVVKHAGSNKFYMVIFNFFHKCSQNKRRNFTSLKSMLESLHMAQMVAISYKAS